MPWHHVCVTTEAARRLRIEGKAKRLNIGPGTELKCLIRRFGITPVRGCKCNQRAATMDRNGPDWCERNMETIVDWLAEEARRRKLPFMRAAACVLVRRAIRNARRKMKILEEPEPVPG